MIFQGRNLKMEDGRIESGTLTKVVVANEDGDQHQVFSGFKMDARTVGGQQGGDFVNGFLINMFAKNIRYVGSEAGDNIFGFKGNDVFLGNDGDDIFSPGRGKDRMTGGTGSDRFIFDPGFGKDIITDFDADGGVGAQDFIDGVFADATIIQNGANTVLDFGDGDTLTLLNVNALQITVADFV